MSIASIIGNPFSAAFTMTERARLIAINTGAGLVMPNEADNEIIPVSSGIVGFLSKVVDFSGFALLIPGLIATPVGAAIFGAVVLNGLLKSVNSGSNLIGSLLSFDLMGIVTNGLATAGNLITVLPMGKLFSQGLGKTGELITRAANATGGGTSSYIAGTAGVLYGKELYQGSRILLNLNSTGGSSVPIMQRLGEWAGRATKDLRAGWAVGVA